MKASRKAAIVAAGYVLAFLAAWAVYAVYVALTSGPDRQAYAGMYAFGDSFLFLGVFAVASVPATATWLFFLRQVRSFWIGISVVALSIAATGLAAMIVYLALRHVPPNDPHSAWAALAVLRVLVAPCFGLAFLVSAVFAPSRGSRVALLAALAMEIVTFSPFVVMWFQAAALAGSG